VLHVPPSNDAARLRVDRDQFPQRAGRAVPDVPAIAGSAITRSPSRTSPAFAPLSGTVSTTAPLARSMRRSCPVAQAFALALTPWVETSVGRIDQLLDALTRVARGECVVDPAIVSELLERSRTADPLDELTSREREILALIAEGRSNQGICQALWLSPKTVETHIRSLFGKLDIPIASEDNRRVLAVLAYLRR
jgi:DNA-binding CsgD family transcriptional regulator